MTEETLVRTTNEGCDYIIIEHIDSKKVKIKFLDEHCFCKITPTTSLKTGSIKNPYFKKKYNVGYIGDGVYKSTEKGISTRIYNCWDFMIERCYNEKRNVKNKNYTNVVVCEEWHNFQNYAEWYEKSYIEGFELDKDLLQQDVENKIYSPETCIFIDCTVNLFLASGKGIRNKNPNDVYKIKNSSKYTCRCSNPFTRKIEFIGNFDCPEEAHTAWLTRKLELAKLLAAKQNDPRVAEALLDRYENYNC